MALCNPLFMFLGLEGVHSALVPMSWFSKVCYFITSDYVLLKLPQIKFWHFYSQSHNNSSLTQKFWTMSFIFSVLTGILMVIMQVTFLKGHLIQNEIMLMLQNASLRNSETDMWAWMPTAKTSMPKCGKKERNCLFKSYTDLE